MIYQTEHKPKELESEFLDKIIAFACQYLNLYFEELHITFESMNHTAAYVDFDIVDEVVEMTLNDRLYKFKGELERTIFHEMVHVKQIQSGKLSTTTPARWLGNTYENYNYHELPWEIEAYALEEVMYQEWENQNG